MKISNDRYEFEIVDKMPYGYDIWNIGKNMVDGYLPLAQVYDNKINPDTLKAIKIEDEQELELLRDCASYGVDNLDKCRKALNYKPRGWLKKKQIALAEQAIKYFEELA